MKKTKKVSTYPHIKELEPLSRREYYEMVYMVFVCLIGVLVIMALVGVFWIVGKQLFINY